MWFISNLVADFKSILTRFEKLTIFEWAFFNNHNGNKGIKIHFKMSQMINKLHQKSQDGDFAQLHCIEVLLAYLWRSLFSRQLSAPCSDWMLLWSWIEQMIETFSRKNVATFSHYIAGLITQMRNIETFKEITL